MRNIYFIINIGLPNSNTGFSKNKLSASGKNAKPPKNDFGVPLGGVIISVFEITTPKETGECFLGELHNSCFLGETSSETFWKKC